MLQERRSIGIRPGTLPLQHPHILYDLPTKLSTTKMVSAVFYLNNKEAKREVKVNHNNETLPFCSEPKY